MKQDLTTQLWHTMPFHILALILIIFGTAYNYIYIPSLNYELTAFNETTLAIRELWWVGLAIFIELTAIVYNIARK